MAIKVELHAHTADDPEDRIDHTAPELIEHAARLGYGALAITLHDRYTSDPALAHFASARGLTLLPAVERTIEGRHVLLVNFPAESGQVAGFESLRALKRAWPSGLVIAPHPFFPMGHSLGPALLNEHADLWDAVEVNAFHVPGIDFNRRARRWASARGLPLVGNCDVHQLEQLGTTFSLVDVQGEATPDAICAAIRAGRVSVQTRPLSYLMAARVAGRAMLSKFRPPSE
jgi:hypothetical protein